MRPLAVWRALEFATLYLILPVGFATAISPDYIWVVLLLITVLAGVLLACTPRFRLRQLLGPLPRGSLLFTLAFGTLVLAIGVLLATTLAPESLFWIPREAPELWLLIMILYPLISAIPQELVFRVLFFARYGMLFKNPRQAMLINGGCFALAHLFLWNVPAVVLSGVGGVIFAYAYQQRGSFGFACLLHSVAGQILFTTGAGVFFYHDFVN